MVAGEAEIASIMAIRPPSMRLAISISPSRVSSSTVPISRMYMRTGSVVRPNSLSTVDRAASASSSASSTVAAVGVGVVQQQHLGVGRLLVHRHAQVVEHGDHDFQRLGVDQLVGQVVGDFGVRQVAARLAQRDQGLQALAALGISSSDRTVSSRPNSFIKARSFALLIFMRSGLTFSVGLAPPVRRPDRPRCPTGPGLRPGLRFGGVLGLAAALGAGLAGASASAAAALGGRPGFFFTTSSVAAALTGFFTSSLAVAFSDGLAGDFVGALAWLSLRASRRHWLGLRRGLDDLRAWPWPAGAGLITFLAAGFAAGLTSFPDF